MDGSDQRFQELAVALGGVAPPIAAGVAIGGYHQPNLIIKIGGDVVHHGIDLVDGSPAPARLHGQVRHVRVGGESVKRVEGVGVKDAFKGIALDDKELVFAFGHALNHGGSESIIDAGAQCAGPHPKQQR